MKELLHASIGAQLRLLHMLLTALAQQHIRPSVAGSMRAHALTQIIRSIKDLGDARERAILEMQGSVTKALDQVTAVTSALGGMSTEHLPEELRPGVARIARSMNELKRVAPSQLTEKEKEALSGIYALFDPLIARFEEMKRSFENLKP